MIDFRRALGLSYVMRWISPQLTLYKVRGTRVNNVAGAGMQKSFATTRWTDSREHNCAGFAVKVSVRSPG